MPKSVNTTMRRHDAHKDPNPTEQLEASGKDEAAQIHCGSRTVKRIEKAEQKRQDEQGGRAVERIDGATWTEVKGKGHKATKNRAQVRQKLGRRCGERKGDQG